MSRVLVDPWVSRRIERDPESDAKRIERKRRKATRQAEGMLMPDAEVAEAEGGIQGVEAERLAYESRLRKCEARRWMRARKWLRECSETDLAAFNGLWLRRWMYSDEYVLPHRAEYALDIMHDIGRAKTGRPLFVSWPTSKGDSALPEVTSYAE